jgi:DEAD/DEAH box helicase domain-containing protein
VDPDLEPDALVQWLRERPYYDGQIRDHRRVPGQAAETAEVDLESRLESALSKSGITDLYRHQTAAVEAVRGGDNVVLATPTASGKSLAYTVPAFERAMDHGGRTLYLGPQNALIADQAETLSKLAHGLGFGSRVSVAEYTGRLSKSEKRDVRDRRPTVLLSNPDMLHYGVLPHAHRLWEWLAKSLETVVIDEVHGYRGVFGSHVALTLRRLTRVCERFGSDPQYVCCSATIGNPVEHAARVTGKSPETFRLVDEDTSAAGAKHWLLWNPPEYDDGGGGERGGTADGPGGSAGNTTGGSGRRRSSHVETKDLFVDLVARGFQTLAFTRARQTAERYATDSASDLRERGHTDAAASVTAYQGSLRNDRRREIESGLHDGSVRGVWSTNALELGVDVGELDAVLIDGYPGTRMSAFQQAGRAGRDDDEALVILVGGEDQLDQYLLRNPADFWAGDPERAVCDPENAELLPDHVASAAAENWLRTTDETHFGESFPDVVTALTGEGRLDRRETDAGLRWLHAGDGSPQHGMSLRTIARREVDLLDDRSGDVISSLSFADALRDAHEGAIYHHQGTTYEVVDLDLDRDVATLQPTWADYYTRVLHDKAMTIETEEKAKPLPGRPDTKVRFGAVTMRKQITGFERRDPKRGETIGRESLELPETTLRTSALYFTVPADVEAAMRKSGGEYGFNGGIHAAEHGAISLFPLSFLCDRGDIGGLSTPYHPQTEQSTIFIYDGYPGGVGLTKSGYDEIGTLLARTRRMIRDCECTDGCPACVQSPHCGNANDPLSKPEAGMLLDALTDGDDVGA